ncbi:hypothetical protein [Rhodococcus sp. A5(2022)]|uniref:hypothetical protein n=1 Tax=Rhodococcus sp. A5(2022) TaxID=3003588 RepID=UPI0022A8B74D|nr:hypothetical protein [Rhodococcus sp. A5(2022)]MCZ1073308.1 hypothetical protein [Rhodococcus sp. A5(2022)]
MLTLQIVVAGINTLQELPIHNHFPAYLHLRQKAVATGSFNVIEPDWNEVGELLKMPGGPPRKPNYRPFSSRTVKDPSGYWLNRNLAGSYAPSSLRSTARFMLNASGDGFALPDSHAQQALAILLKDTKVPAWALAAYYLRNYGFVFDGGGGYRELIDAFKKEFLFDAGSDFSILFEDDDPLLSVEWFEPFTSPEEGEMQKEDSLDV